MDPQQRGAAPVASVNLLGSMDELLIAWPGIPRHRMCTWDLGIFTPKGMRRCLLAV